MSDTSVAAILARRRSRAPSGTLDHSLNTSIDTSARPHMSLQGARVLQSPASPSSPVSVPDTYSGVLSPAEHRAEYPQLLEFREVPHQGKSLASSITALQAAVVAMSLGAFVSVAVRSNSTVDAIIHLSYGHGTIIFSPRTARGVLPDLLRSHIPISSLSAIVCSDVVEPTPSLFLQNEDGYVLFVIMSECVWYCCCTAVPACR